jgi:hypothetical protein
MAQEQQQTPVDTQNLATVVTEWRRICDEIAAHKQQASEKGKRVKVLEGIILNIMKQQNLGALDLKSSGGRILYQKKEGKTGLNAKSLQKLLTEHMKDEAKAAEALKYINEHREAVTKEKLAYEKN